MPTPVCSSALARGEARRVGLSAGLVALALRVRKGALVPIYIVPGQNLRRRTDPRPPTQRVVVINPASADAAAAAAPRPVGALNVPDRRGPALNSTSKDVVRGQLVVHPAVLLPAPAPGRLIHGFIFIDQYLISILLGVTA